MALDIFKLLGTIEVDNKKAIGALDDTSKKGQETENKFGNAMKKIGKGAAVVGKAVVTGLAAGGAAMAGLITKSTQLAGELEQNMGGSEAVFGKFADKVQGKAKEAFSNMGLSTSDYLATANKMGALFQGAGFSIEDSMNLSSDAMQRAADVASIMGLDTSAAMEAVAGAAKGNFTMMDNLGVAMNDTTLNAYALEKGIGKTTAEMTNQEKIGLAMELFMDKTAYAAGNYAKENETLAGSLGTAKAALTNFLDGSGDVDSLVSAFTNAAGVIIDQVSEIAPRLISGLGEIVNKVMPMLPGLIGQLLPVIVEGAVSLVQGLVNAFPTVVQTLMGMLPALIDGVMQIISSLIEALPTIIEALVSALPTLLPQLINGVMGLIVMLCNNLMDIIQPIIDYLPDIIISIVQAIVANLPALIDGIITLVMGIVEAIPELIQSLVDALPTVISLLVEALLSNLPKIIAGLIKVIGGIVKALPKIFASLIKGIGNIFVGIWDGIKKTFSSTDNWFGATFQKAKNAVQNAFASVKNFFANIWKGIKNAFANVGAWFKNIFSSAKNGVTNAWSSVTGFFSRIKNGIANAFSNIKEKLSAPFQKARDTIKGIADKIKGFFKGNISMPKIKLPHFSVSPAGWKIGDLLKGKLPKLGIKWYAEAMDNPMIMTRPTIFGYNAATGQLMGGGEAGSEVVSGTNTLMNMIGAAVESKTTAPMERIISVLISILNAILGGNEEMIQAVLAGHTLKIGEREFGRLVKEYA